ncbi:TIGR01457 family HAD-type hydrolase [Paenibacillus sp. HB172176]|uniref:TIGR01457 family HAD-type hydrolase n=1 Tax=Paenibacillus sp. HB172176 TaxID=2493690 RepID=UPI00198150A3|nr:TIGR01457 family HAD-type hydrolase [Paenibacillus sp. HB172176]
MQQQLPALKGLLIDLDGTLYHGAKPIENADRFIEMLIATEMPYRFVTNNSSATPEQVADKLSAMGIPANSELVCTSAQAAADYISKEKEGASVFVIGEEGLRSELAHAGLELTEEMPDFVVQGIDRGFRYERGAEAVRYIREGARSIMTNPDLLLPSTDGLIPGAGSIGAMLQAASGIEPVVIGKPSPILMNYALQRLGLPSDETWMVGDNIATDIAAGKAAGCGTILVLTGLTTADNYEKYAQAAGCRPDLICNNLDILMTAVTNIR